MDGMEERHLRRGKSMARSEEHTSELQSPCNLVCRLLLEKKKKRTSFRSTSHSPSFCPTSTNRCRHCEYAEDAEPRWRVAMERVAVRYFPTHGNSSLRINR